MVRKGICTPELILGFIIILFVFQTLLDDYFGAFSYIDEMVALIALIGCVCRIMKNNGKISREYVLLVMFLSMYVLICLGANYLYQFQNKISVIKDMITNVKFYLSIAFVSLFMTQDPESYRLIPVLAKVLTVFLFIVFIVDYVLDIFPSGYRYGIKYTQMFFGHPTYLAGCCIFLVALLAFYGTKKNKWFIMPNLIMISMTLRGKAMAGVILFLALYIIVILKHSKINLFQIFLIGITAIAVAWKQIQFYFVKLSGASARSVMLNTSLKVLKDFFPIGTGFGTYASHEAGAQYSPVYTMYGFRGVEELSGTGYATFFDDQFWPIVFGQGGVIGTICYLVLLILVFTKIQKLQKINEDAYISGLFVFSYLLISSTSEPAFNNSIAIPMGVVLGMGFVVSKRTNIFHMNI